MSAIIRPDLARLFCRTSVSRDVLLISVHVSMPFISSKRKAEGGGELGAHGCGTSVTESLVPGLIRARQYTATQWYRMMCYELGAGCAGKVDREIPGLHCTSTNRGPPSHALPRRKSDFTVTISRVFLWMEIIISRNTDV